MDKKEEFKPVDGTLNEAKEFLKANYIQGTICPCCSQHVKLYKRIFPIASALVCIALYQASLKLTDKRGYINVPKLVDNMKGTAHQGGYGTLGQHWSLIEQMPGDREDGSHRVGWWRLTELGMAFVMGEATIPKYVGIYNQTVYNKPYGPDITIKIALKNKFDYDQLMATA